MPIYTRKQALAIAKQIRSCPPRTVRDDPAQSREYDRHREHCPFCSTDICPETDAWRILAASAADADMINPEMAPGQIRQIRPERSAWRDHLYINPPAVLVLEPVRPSDNTVLTVQTWHDIYLGAPGDLAVPAHLMDGPGELIIESWNHYRLTPDSLGRVMGTVGTPVVEAVIRMIREPDFVPSWAARFSEIKTDDPRVYFRQLEKKVASMFSASISTPVQSLAKEISRHISGASWSWTPGTLEECLGTIRLPDDYMPLSAAPAGTAELVGVFYRFENQRLASVSPVRFPVLREEVMAGEYIVTGTVPHILTDAHGLTVQCYLENIDEQRLFRGDWTRDDFSDHYMIRFLKDKDPSERVSVVICDGSPL